MTSIVKNRRAAIIVAVAVILLAMSGIIRTTAAALQVNDLQDDSAGIIASDPSGTGIDGCNGDCALCGLCTGETTDLLANPVIQEYRE
ncbi:MAG: hypothetical protein JW712_08430 [Dehalococcoidales bacterium]|nr:hypothetical protein [Dehalococcoidales bacterium]